MINLPNKQLFITDTILRDAHQSQAATRMRTEDMLPVCEYLDSVGYYSLECWGGATFDTCMRYLDEDPWERLRTLRKALPKTKLQMLLRGQNLLGYRQYPDDVVDCFCGKAIENGIDIVRVFDALNDLRNLECPINSIKRHGGTVEGAISFTTGPVFDDDYYIEKAKSLQSMGADTVCIKDMANLLLPQRAFELVSKLKNSIDIPIHLHTHDTAGTGEMVYLAAIFAGVDIIDCALSPFSGGTSQPATETFVATLSGTERDTKLNTDCLNKAASHFKTVAGKMASEGLVDEKVLRPEPGALTYQVPGGMLSNLLSQLTAIGAEEKYEEVLKETPRVRADFGYPPLVTPTSQIIGAQAVINVTEGRYKRFTSESKALLRGEYGSLPVDPDKSVLKAAIGDSPVINYRPADKLQFEMEMIRAENSDLCKSDEDYLSVAMFPGVARSFLQKKYDDNIREINVFWDNN